MAGANRQHSEGLKWPHNGLSSWGCVLSSPPPPDQYLYQNNEEKQEQIHYIEIKF
jgi:hypothetical protein